MLEFYQAYADYRDMMDLTEEMMGQAAREVNGCTKASSAKGDRLGQLSLAAPHYARSHYQYWPEAAGAKPEMSDFAGAESVAGPGAALQRRRTPTWRTIPRSPTGKTIANMFEAVAEEHLSSRPPSTNFPLAISPLSKNKPDEPDWVERFEIFVGGMEIANGFSELNDPEEQRRRFEQQLQERERGDEEAHQMDEDYIRALSFGLPPTGGVGVGIDRLTMLLTNSSTIRDVILFPLLRPERVAAEEPESAAESTQSA